MSIINKGTAFSNGEQLTADKLNDLVDLATFDQSATDSASTTVNSSGQIVVADSGVSTAKIAADAVTTAKILDANVTKAKIEDVADYKVLGNVSGAAAAPAEVAVLDEDDMVSDSATALATQQSIKAYVDEGFTPSSYSGVESVTLPNGLIMKFGLATGRTSEGSLDITFGTAFPNAIISVQAIPTNPTGGVSASYDYFYQVKDQSLLNKITLQVQHPSIAGFGIAHNVNWQAIGY